MNNDYSNHEFYQANREETTQSAPRQSHGLASASFALALASAFTFFIFYLSIPLGALAILLALLSRGSAPLSRRGKTVLGIALAAMIGSTVVTGVSVYRIYTTPALRSQFRSMVEYYSRYYLGGDVSDDAPPIRSFGDGDAGRGSDLIPGGDFI